MVQGARQRPDRGRIFRLAKDTSGANKPAGTAPGKG